MTNIRDITSKEALEREFDSISRVFETFTKDEVLRIEWGTKEAFEKQAEAIATGIQEKVQKYLASVNNPELGVGISRPTWYRLQEIQEGIELLLQLLTRSEVK